MWKKIMWILVPVMILAILVTIILYWENGRLIFNNRAVPIEAEKAKIQEIIDFEQQKLSECEELLSPYNEKASKLDIELRPELDRKHSVNYMGKVEKHDFQADYWMPKHYSSQISVYVYKDDMLLEEQVSYDTISYFGTYFDLVEVNNKGETIEFNENPFENTCFQFDSFITSLLKQASDFLQE